MIQLSNVCNCLISTSFRSDITVSTLTSENGDRQLSTPKVLVSNGTLEYSKVEYGKSNDIHRKHIMTFINNLQSTKNRNDRSKCVKPWQKSSK